MVNPPRKYRDGREHIRWVVSWLAVRGASRRRPLWIALWTGFEQPPVPKGKADYDRFRDWMMDKATKKGYAVRCPDGKVRELRLPATFAMFRNQAYGEDRGFHYAVKCLASWQTFKILQVYAGTRGIPHTTRDRDFPWKYGSLPDPARFDPRRVKALDPAHTLRPAPDLAEVLGEIERPEGRKTPEGWGSPVGNLERPMALARVPDPRMTL